MLRELGAKASLSTTIEGESLLNDGSAVVMFVVLKKIAVSGMPPASEVLFDLFRIRAGSTTTSSGGLPLVIDVSQRSDLGRSRSRGS